jgi:GST-like protein
MYTLYGSRGSGSAAVEAALELARLPYRGVRASTWEAGSAQDELRKLNPLGQIPTLLLPEGDVLTESAAILIHLGLEHPHSGLLPQDASSRGQAIRGLVYIAANCYSAISIIDYPERWHADPDEATGARVRQAARARLHDHWIIFADQFSPLLGAGAPGALDLLACVVSKWSGARAHLRDHRPAFETLLEATEKHASVAAVFARHWPD